MYNPVKYSEINTEIEALLKYIQFNHGSYSAPFFKIYGEGSEKQLINAIRRKIKSKIKSEAKKY